MIIQIIIGVFLIFLGSKYIRLTFGTLIFMAISYVSFSFLTYLGFSEGLVNGDMNVMYSSMISCCILGLGIGYYASDYAKMFMTNLIAFACGGIFITIVLCPVTMSVTVRYLMMPIFSIISYCFAFKD